MSASRTKISGILLAAGESKRMGSPKQLLPLGGKTVIEHGVHNLLQSDIAELIVVLGAEASRIEALLAGRPVKTVFNPLFDQGMGSSVAAGIKSLGQGVDGVLLALADQPLVPAQVVDLLIRSFKSSGKGIVLPTWKGKRGHPVIFGPAYIPALMLANGDHGGRDIVRSHPQDVLEVQVESQGVCLDLDSFADYERISSMWESSATVPEGSGPGKEGRTR